jgi:mono/diheme cytochrome c family protein
MKRVLLIAAICFAATQAHDIITTPVTWDREISRIVYARCAGCHQPGGRAFSLLTYAEARPWAVAIKEEVEERRMPPWGAVKGFGEFRNDQALTPEQIELIVGWASGGAPEGEPKDLPNEPKPPVSAPAQNSRDGLSITSGTKLEKALLLDGIWPRAVSRNTSFQVTVEMPDGVIEPLLWVYQYRPGFEHPFLLRQPLRLPRGAIIHGVPSDSSLLLLQTTATASREHRSERY